MNNSNQKDKPKLNIMTESLSRKQIIIPMGTNNAERVIAQSNVYVANINRLLKDINLKFLLTTFTLIIRELLSLLTR